MFELTRKDAGIFKNKDLLSTTINDSLSAITIPHAIKERQ
jgi:hypothetical protein